MQPLPKDLCVARTANVIAPWISLLSSPSEMYCYWLSPSSESPFADDTLVLLGMFMYWSSMR